MTTPQSIVVLYDTMGEVSNDLFGTYCQQLYATTDPREREAWQLRIDALDLERSAIHPDDAAHLQRATARWRAERQAILLHSSACPTNSAPSSSPTSSTPSSPDAPSEPQPHLSPLR